MILTEMFEQNMVPSQQVVRSAIRLCCEWGQSRLAMDIIHRLESMPGHGPASSESWVQVLMAAADQQDVSDR